MNKRSIRKLLRHLDEPTAIRLSERHPGLTDADNERLLRRIEEELAASQSIPAPPPEPVIEQKPCRFESLRGIAAAAACFVVCGGTVAGLFWLQNHPPMVHAPEANTAVRQETASRSTLSVQAPKLTAEKYCGIGERCAVSHLCASGTLWVTAEQADFGEDSLFGVRLTIESEHAQAWDGGSTFLLDNLLLETDGRLLSPCGIDREELSEGYPYAVTLRDGETMTLTLYYDTAGSAPTVLHTGADASAPCIQLE